MSLFSNLIKISYNLLSELDTIRPLTRIHNWPQSEQTTSWSVIHQKKKKLHGPLTRITTTTCEQLPVD
jgi:hypothetical protein